jgi:DNA-directed RNA polymerase beta subunit
MSRMPALLMLSLFASAGCTVILTKKRPLNSTSQGSGIALNVMSLATTTIVGAQSTLVFSGTAKPSGLEKCAAHIASIKVKWPRGEIQSYNPKLPAGTVTFIIRCHNRGERKLVDFRVANFREPQYSDRMARRHLGILCRCR